MRSPPVHITYAGVAAVFAYLQKAHKNLGVAVDGPARDSNGKEERKLTGRGTPNKRVEWKEGRERQESVEAGNEGERRSSREDTGGSKARRRK
eukprot:1939497-Rhodomonas_salina.1